MATTSLYFMRMGNRRTQFMRKAIPQNGKRDRSRSRRSDRAPAPTPPRSAAQIVANSSKNNGKRSRSRSPRRVSSQLQQAQPSMQVDSDTQPQPYMPVDPDTQAAPMQPGYTSHHWNPKTYQVARLRRQVDPDTQAAPMQPGYDSWEPPDTQAVRTYPQLSDTERGQATPMERGFSASWEDRGMHGPKTTVSHWNEEALEDSVGALQARVAAARQRPPDHRDHRDNRDNRTPPPDSEPTTGEGKGEGK